MSSLTKRLPKQISKNNIQTKEVLKKVSLADGITLTYNIEEDESDK